MAKEEKTTEELKSGNVDEIATEIKGGKKEGEVKRDDVKKDRVKFNSNKILIRPIVTEKVSNLVSIGKYVFEVSIGANKNEIAKAIRSVYDIMPARVNVMKRSGKVVARGRVKGKRKDWKKAVITLPRGKTIEIHEGM